MIFLPMVFFVGLSFQGTPGKPHQEKGQSLESLKAELERKKQAFNRLIRMRVRRSLLLPVSEDDLLAFSRPLEGIPAEEFKAIMDKEANHTIRLQERLLALRRGVFMQGSSPFAAPSGIAPKKKENKGGKKPLPKGGKKPSNPQGGKMGEGRAALLDPVTGAVDHSLDLVRIPSTLRKRKGPVLPLPLAMDPLLGGKPVIAKIQPTKKLEKRLRVLLDAGFPRNALVLVDEALKKERRSLRLHYLRARILESLGRMEEARKVLKVIAKVDTEQDEDGKELQGPWAKAANSALEYLGWRESVRSKVFNIPEIKDLKW